MRFKVFGQNGRNPTRSAAILMVGALSAGCSSSAMRFDESFTDGLFTSSTQNQRQIITKAENQPFPGDAGAAASASALAPVYSGSVQRAALAPAPGAAPALAPVGSAALAAPMPALDRTSTGTAAKPAPVQSDAQQGWSRAGGTQVTIRQGETIYNLSRRFGVPADAIMKANGISQATGLAAGQQIVIPTYGHSRNGPVSAPDSNPNVARASAGPGLTQHVPGQTTPLQAESRAAASADSRTGGYRVVAGDTLFGIAKKTGASAEGIKAANGLSNGFIRVGQVLTIPTSGSAQIASAAPAKVDSFPTGTTGQSNARQVEAKTEPAAYTPPAKKERLVEQAALNPSAAAPDATGIGRMRWPVRGRVISGFGGSGGGKNNDGIDIAVPEGTPVKAAENGVVIYAGDGLKEFGNTVLVRHENGLVTVYGHAGEIKVARGDTVRRGQEIASSGMSGSAQTPKLHFEVRKDSAPVDPATFLE